MQVSAAQLKRIAKGAPNNDNIQSVVIALNQYGSRFGLDLPHRLAQFIAQVAHESGGFHYDREIASGAAYEGRVKGLGNTQKGDGKRFKGRTAMQLTGRANYRAFTAWCRKFMPDCPDFEKQPDLVNTDPYEGLVPIWYWDSRKLNSYADRGDIEMITRRVNGGTNGLADRLDYYDRAAFILLGYKLGQYREFQTFAKRKGWLGDGIIDGAAGPRTRSALHMALVNMTASDSQPAGIMAAPVTQEVEKEVKVEVPFETPVPVAVGSESLKKPFYQDPDFIERVGTGTAGTTLLSSFGGADWKTVAVLAVAVFCIGGGIWYILRLRKQARQEVRIADVKAQAAEIRSAM